MTDPLVMIAGGGIGGLATALTLEQIGLRCVVFEAAPAMRPLGVGINLQPNAVRELFELGLGADILDTVGVPSREWALVGLNGNDIYSEPRGRLAGYDWPQYSVHRGRFQVALFHALCARAGREAVRLGHRVTGYRRNPDGSVTARIERTDGTLTEETGALLIGADGIHSAIRAQMHPDQPPIHWGGALMWRGTTLARPIRTGASFIGLGTRRQRMVIYPISHPDPDDGLAEINWVAEVTLDDADGWKKAGWFRQVEVGDFAHLFHGWSWDWLGVPALLHGADMAYENPMIDRDPVRTWVDGPVALLGDAAHAMYPTGSNGASQAIVDARVLGASLLAHGIEPAALRAYDNRLCGPVSQLVQRNREAGPFGLLNLVEDRCGGTFDDIDKVVPRAERAEYMRAYRAAAGFDRDTLNAAPPTIPDGAYIGAAASA